MLVQSLLIVPLHRHGSGLRSDSPPAVRSLNQTIGQGSHSGAPCLICTSLAQFTTADATERPFSAADASVPLALPVQHPPIAPVPLAAAPRGPPC